MRAGDTIQERYHLEDRLGSGGMAEVWCALDDRLQRKVAIKFLAPALTEDPEFLVRFFSEAQAVARISHPNVVKVLDFGEHDGAPYLVMEYVAGGSLAERLGEPVPVDRAFALVAAAAAGAGAAHDAGVVHRDLKPANILLDEDDNPKLADFGIAASARSERLTATGAAIGSPHYISPEQASGADASPASDVYSLGIVLFELLTGRRPFTGENITAVAIAHVEVEPPAPSTIVPELEPAADAVVLKCLAKDPAERFSNGNELADVLGHSTGPIAVLEEALAPLAAATGWTRRRTLLAAVAALVVITLLSAGVVARMGDEPSASAAETYERMDDVGGLSVTPSRSPSPGENSVVSQKSPTPTPTPSPTEEEAPTPTPEPKRTRRQQQEPTPEPTPSDEPSPEPTTEQEATPAP